MPLLPPIFPAQIEQVIYSIYYENLVLAQQMFLVTLFILD